MDGYVGIDVSKGQLDVLLARGEKREGQQFTNSKTGWGKLHSWLGRRLAASQVAVCLEATGAYGEGVAQYLYEAGYRVSMVNPARIKGYAASQMQRNKTDKLDAALIAEFCRTQQPEAWSPPSPEVRELQQWVRQLDDLMQARQSARNHLEKSDLAAALVTQWQAQIALLDAQIALTRQTISDLLDQHPTLKRQADLLRSIPGLADITIGKLLAECRALSAFHDVRQLVAFVGLNPRQHTSGSSIHKRAHISRTGSASLRSALYMPALSAMQCNPLLSAFAQRLRARGLTGKAVVVAVMRKLLHLVYGVLKSGQPFDANWALAS
jgi:transposase